MERLTDLDELALRCTPRGRQLISEAIQSYRAGAYRAAVVMCWIAITFDLIDKLRDLDLSGDAAAKAEIKQLNTWQEQLDQGNQAALSKLLEFEKNLLVLVRDKFEFFDAIEYTDLERLRLDRHRCAHPSFAGLQEPFRPSAEAARLHLRNALVHCLIRPPVQGKAALASIEAIVSSAYFPKDRTKARVQLDALVKEPREALLRAAADKLVYFFLDAGPLHLDRRATSAVGALLDIKRDVVEPRIVSQLHKVAAQATGDTVANLLRFIAQLPELWPLLNENVSDLCKACVEQAAPTNFSFGDLSSLPELNATIDSRIAKLDNESLRQVIESGFRSAAATVRAIEIYKESGSFSTANSRADGLIIPLLPNFTKEDMLSVLQAAQSNGEIRASFRFSHLVSLLRTLIPNDLDAMLKVTDLESFIEEQDE